MSVGEIIRLLREDRGWTQVKLAKEAKLAASQIAHFEAGDRDPSLGSIIALCNGLSVTPDQLLGFEKPIGMSYPVTLDLYNNVGTIRARVCRACGSIREEW